MRVRPPAAARPACCGSGGEVRASLGTKLYEAQLSGVEEMTLRGSQNYTTLGISRGMCRYMCLDSFLRTSTEGLSGSSPPRPTVAVVSGRGTAPPHPRTGLRRAAVQRVGDPLPYLRATGTGIAECQRVAHRICRSRVKRTSALEAHRPDLVQIAREPDADARRKQPCQPGWVPCVA